jgi:hypothetical protein
LDPHFVPIKKSSLTKARPAEGIFFWMQSARHDKGYATSGIAANPFDYAQWQALAKDARMGQPPFVMGKEEQSMEKAGPGPGLYFLAKEARPRTMIKEVKIPAPSAPLRAGSVSAKNADTRTGHPSGL